MKRTPALSGLSGARTYYFYKNLARTSPGTTVIVRPDDELEIWQDNLATLQEYIFPERKSAIITFPENDPLQQNIALLILLSRPGPKKQPIILLTTAAGLNQKIYSPQRFWQQAVQPIKINRPCPPDKLKQFLVNAGYQAREMVTQPGEFSQRGEVVDIWEIRQKKPWRLVYDGDIIESIKEFSVNTQRSENWHENDFILAMTSGSDITLKQFLGKTPIDYNSDFPTEMFRSLDYFSGDISSFIRELKKYYLAGYQIYFFAENSGEKERLEDILIENDFSLEKLAILVGLWHGPFATTAAAKEKLAFFNCQQIFYQRPRALPKKFIIPSPPIQSLPEIHPGDYVVHERYGIGRYQGLTILRKENEAGEYLTIQYLGDDRLYIPVNDFRLIHPYLGSEGKRPRLHSLDTVAWERLKQRARQKAELIARELLQHYAGRRKTPAPVFSPEPRWESELAAGFPYPLTSDQENTIDDILGKMSRGELLDYLVIGDVGFGKTEVALRAAMRAAVNSYQTAFLVPTTVLAMQHYKTFQERLKPFPINLAILTRFQTTAEQKKIISEIKKGVIDIVIGTHRLLAEDVSFANLGLFLVDEEHRFGVKQKEHIRHLSGQTSTIYFTATPIPRTLMMTLGNLRQLSIIETAPIGRQPIITSVQPWNLETAIGAINQELRRNGQVYYVHNRIETMLSRFHQLEKLVPARWAFIHGRLPAKKIEKVMNDFWNKKIDCLMATTIIESGLDIPAVNTMIIEEAENFGLAQLYQLRGRIGRSDIQAYCYFFYLNNFTEPSQKRLLAIREFGHLGSGYSLARRDMEIRGAGNILGYQQHGFINNIGLELYLRLIGEASQKLVTGKIHPGEMGEPPAIIDLKIPALIPASYISSESQRIYYYRRLVSAEDNPELENINQEITDRFGRPPEEFQNLLFIARLQIYARKLKIASIRETAESINIVFTAEASLKENFVKEVLANYWQGIRFSPRETAITIEKKFFPNQSPKDILTTILEKM